MPIVHQQLLCHMNVAGSQLGSSQHCSKERRLPPGMHPAFLQQEECYPGGRRQVNSDVLQKGTQGLFLDLKACHEKPQDKYALVEEVTLNTREQNKELGHMDQPSSSKGHNKKRKSNHYVNAVELPHRHKEYRPRLCEFKGFLDRICIFHHPGKA
jgi:hypothetical protein